MPMKKSAIEKLLREPNVAVVAVARELAGFIWDISALAMSLAVPCEAQAT